MPVILPIVKEIVCVCYPKPEHALALLNTHYIGEGYSQRLRIEPKASGVNRENLVSGWDSFVHKRWEL